MKKGFTLVELLATIIILGLVVAISFPIYKNSIKSSKEKAYKNQIETIKIATSKWATENIDLLPNQENDSISIRLIDLKKAGFLPVDIKDPRNKKNLPNDMVIRIIYKQNDYEFEVDENSGTNIDEEPNINGPTIILNGNSIVNIKINDNYIEEGAVATKKDGTHIDKIDIIYKLNNNQVANIDTSKSNTYTVIYMANDGINTSTITRTVIISN